MRIRLRSYQSEAGRKQQGHRHLPRRRTPRIPQGHHGLEIAKGISPSLAKRTVAMTLDGELVDLAEQISRDAKIEFINREDPRALELIRHDCAHVLAEAVQALWPGTQVTIGPVIENGFYYDFFRNEPFTPETSPRSRRRCGRSSRATSRSRGKSGLARRRAGFSRHGRGVQGRDHRRHPGSEPIKIYQQGDWFDLCRGPHMTSTGKIGGAFKLMKVAGAYWRGDSNNPMLPASTARRSPSRTSSTPT